jgi:hypothetical protein
MKTLRYYAEPSLDTDDAGLAYVTLYGILANTMAS